jgi:hypothetical protein
MGDMDVTKVIHRVLEPELARMRDDLKKQWPKEDPELLLLQWLCEKHGLQVPAKKAGTAKGCLAGSDIRSSQTGRSSQSGAFVHGARSVA